MKFLKIFSKNKDLEDEIETHIDLKTDYYLEKGLNKKAAQKAARRDFGNAERLKEECRDAWTIRFLSGGFRELKYALKQLWNSKSYTIPTVIILGFCIAFNTAIFSRLDQRVLSHYSFPDAKKVQQITLQTAQREWPGIQASFYGKIIEKDTFWKSVVFTRGTTRYLYTGRETQRARVTSATEQIWDIYNQYPKIGRGFTQQDIENGEQAICVITDGMAKEVFGSSRASLNQQIRLNGEIFTVIGVMPPAFRDGWTDVLLPLRLEGDLSTNWENHQVWGRCLFRPKDGLSDEQIQNHLDDVWSAFKATYATLATNLERDQVQFHFKSIFDQVVFSYFDWDIRTLLLWSQMLCAFLFMVGCLNTILLTNAHLERRQKEQTIQLALGSGKWRIMRGIFIHLLLVFFTASVVSIFGKKGLDLMFSHFNFFLSDDTWIHSKFLLNTAMGGTVGFLLCFLFLLVKFHFSKTLEPLRNLSYAFSKKSRATGMVLQFVFSYVLILATIFVTVNTLRITDLDLGFPTDNRYVVDLDFPRWKFEGKPEFKRSLLSEIKDRLLKNPLITSVTVSNRLPAAEGGRTWNFGTNLKSEESETRRLVMIGSGVDPGYFSDSNVKLLRGRYLNDSDLLTQELEILVTSDFVGKHLNGEEPIEKVFDFNIGRNQTQAAKIVGVIAPISFRIENMSSTHQRDFEGYLHHVHEFPHEYHHYHLLISLEAGSILETSYVSSIIQEVEPDIFNLYTAHYEQVSVGAFWLLDGLQKLSIIISALAILLTLFGLFGFLNFKMNSERHEISIRTMLGETRRSTTMRYLKRIWIYLGLGFVFGSITIYITVGLMNSVLTEVNNFELTPYLLAFVSVFVPSLLISLIPLSQIWRINISENLAYE